VRLIAKGGRIGLGEVTETGEPVFVPLERFRTHRNEDKQRKFNRAENVRQIPPGDPDFETLYKRRNDAESINRHLDDALSFRRAKPVSTYPSLASKTETFPNKSLATAITSPTSNCASGPVLPKQSQPANSRPLGLRTFSS
jgi:hypothetical protein